MENCRNLSINYHQISTLSVSLSYVCQLIDDKKVLSEKCENLVKELKTVDRKYQDKLKSVTEK